MDYNWNSYWGEEANLPCWTEPDKAVVDLVNRLNGSGIRDVLDLGCGIGRHAIYLALKGFNVTAVDSSAQALDVLKRGLSGKGLRVNIIQGSYFQDIFTANSFDFVLAFNVIYHGYRKTFDESVHLVHKWLRQDGRFLFSCPTRRDAKYGNGEKVAQHTYKPLNSVTPGDIHYFADEVDITDFLRGFREIKTNIEEHYWNNQRVKQFSSYWQILARK
jgi:tellurite methyltransferase